MVVDGKIAAQIELPLLGLLSEEPLRVVVQKFDKAYAELKKLGCGLTSPFATLEFSCACGEIGKLKSSTRVISIRRQINASTSSCSHRCLRGKTARARWMIVGIFWSGKS